MVWPIAALSLHRIWDAQRSIGERADAGGMDSDLMGAPGDWLKFPATFGSLGEQAEMGAAGFA
jgi:hypothetical protein